VINPFEFSSIVVLTGAGISAESGIKTFRDNGGLWEGHKIEEVATPEAFAQNPPLVHDFYNVRRKQLLESATANEAHRALANFERIFDGKFLLVTQNIDNLHEQGGSSNPIHMHGELLKARCIISDRIFTAPEVMSTATPCPCCDQQGNMRPHIVWFGEMAISMDLIQHSLLKCDLFVAIGTSGQVYPAAGFVQLAKSVGATTIEINLEASAGSVRFDYTYHGPATKVVAAFLDRGEKDSAIT